MSGLLPGRELRINAILFRLTLSAVLFVLNAISVPENYLLTHNKIVS